MPCLKRNYVNNLQLQQKTRMGKEDGSRQWLLPTQFEWISPRGQRKISATVAKMLEFDVVLPKHGRNTNDYHNKCELFRLLHASGLNNITASATKQSNRTPGSQNTFHLRGSKLAKARMVMCKKHFQCPKVTFSRQQNSSAREPSEKKSKCSTRFQIMEFVDEGNLRQKMKKRN